MTDQIFIELPPFYLNQSRWKLHNDCSRLYGWFHIENIEPDRPRKVLEIGAAIHKAMVTAHEQGGDKEAYIKATEMAKAAFKAGMDRGPKLPGDDLEIDDGLKIINRLLPAYWAKYGPAGLNQLWQPLGVELSFCVEVGEGTNVFLVGKIDNLVSYQGNLWLVDYKTMGKLDMREFIKYELDIQLTAYIYGGTKQLTLDARKENKPPVMIRGAIIDGLIKTEIPQFHRELYTRDVQSLREFELEFCMKAWEIASRHAMARKDKPAYDAIVQRMYELGTEAGWKVAFPKNTNHCFRYGTCACRELCAKDTEVRRMGFRQRVPDYVDKAAGWQDPATVSGEGETA